MRREITFKLTEEELTQRRRDLSELVSQYTELEGEKAAADQDFNERMKPIWESIQAAVKPIRTGEATETLEVREEKLFELNTVRYYREDTRELERAQGFQGRSGLVAYAREGSI